MRCALVLLAFVAAYCCPEDALAVRPFVTDDARIVYKGQLEAETYAGMTVDKGDKPTIEARALQGYAFTERFELIAGGFGFTYQDSQARPLDLLVQPKYILHIVSNGASRRGTPEGMNREGHGGLAGGGAL